MRAKAVSTANVTVRWLVRGSTPSGDSLSLLKIIDPVWSVPVRVEAPVEAKRAAGRLDVLSQFDHQYLSASRRVTVDLHVRVCGCSPFGPTIFDLSGPSV